MKKSLLSPLFFCIIIILILSGFPKFAFASDSSGIHVLSVSSYDDSEEPWTHVGASPYIKYYEEVVSSEYITNANATTPVYDDYYVNDFVNQAHVLSTVGSSPWLDSNDGNTSYIYSQAGDYPTHHYDQYYTFQTTDYSITSAVFYFTAKVSGLGPYGYIQIYLYNYSSSSYVLVNSWGIVETAWTSYSVNIFSVGFNTKQLINNLRLKIGLTSGNDATQCRVTVAWLHIGGLISDSANAIIGFSDLDITGLPIAHAYLEWHYKINTGFGDVILYVNNGTEYTLSTASVNNIWAFQVFDVLKYVTSETVANNFTARLYHDHISATGTGIYIDSLKLIVEIGYEWLQNPSFENLGSQTDVNANTLPWWSYESTSEFYGIGTYGIGENGITSDQHHFYGYHSGMPIYQTIFFLDSNLVIGISMYGLHDSSSVKVTILYTDGSFSYKTVSWSGADANYRFLNFSGFVLPNKVIRYFSFEILHGDSSDFTNIDCVSLLATVPKGQTVFAWDLNPQPISRGNNTFRAYQSVGYVFTGFVYGTNGTCYGEGSFSVISGSGTQTGIVVGGVFNFPISARNGLIDYSENFVISVVSTSQNFTIIITGTWVYVGVGETPSGYDYTPVMNLMVFFLFLFVPALILAVRVGMIGFLAGLTLGALCLYMAGMMPLWGVFLMGLVDIMIILKGGGSGGRSGD